MYQDFYLRYYFLVLYTLVLMVSIIIDISWIVSCGSVSTFHKYDKIYYAQNGIYRYTVLIQAPVTVAKVIFLCLVGFVTYD